MLSFLVKLISCVPLQTLRRIGAWFGELTYRHDQSIQKKIKRNLDRVGLDHSLAIKSMRQSGMLVADTLWIWGNSNEKVNALCEDATSDICDEVIAHLKAGDRVLLMTPHVGCYEAAPIFFYERCLKPLGKELTVLYREPRNALFRSFVHMSRVRPGMDPAPADLGGVRKILKAMRNGGILGCLPDQVPGRGEGVWAPFFGEPAFTMTFPMKIARQFNCFIYVACSERVEGRGWRIHFRRLNLDLTGDAVKDATAMNSGLESVIREFPEQYIWNYNRYKVPHGVKKPSGE